MMDPGIRIFLRIRIQEAKILWIQQILSTGINIIYQEKLRSPIMELKK